ncbi:MAG: hypothetical protein RLY78_2971 [Pseudomonadota bacterium]
MTRDLRMADRRRLLAAAALGPVLGATAQHVRAADAPWPQRPIQLVVAFAAGGAGDLVARLVARRLGEALGQPVVIDNKPIPVAAVQSVARARPDGQTWLMAGSGTALTESLFQHLPYRLMEDFVHVSTLASFDLALVTGAGSGLRSVADVLAAARARPGQLNIGTVRIGSTQNLTAELFRAMTGIDVTLVPFRTTGELVTALRGREVQIGFEIVPAVLGQIRSQALTALAITSTRRFAGLPDVPPLAEAGVPGFESSSWNGIAVPAGTPAAIVGRIHQEIGRALALPDVQQGLLEQGAIGQASPPGAMATRMRADIAKWRAVIERAGIPRT